MPRRDPFTSVCRQAAVLADRRVADLHAHTTASDGDLTPSQLVALARQARLLALAITDHDTTAGIAEAVRSAADLPVIPGVEISAEFRGGEVHVLGLFLDPDRAELTAALQTLCVRRRERFRDYLARVRVPVPSHAIAAVEATSASPGRRHVANLLMKSGAARSRFDAFRRFIEPLRDKVIPKILLPVEHAIALIHRAGGVASLAHPPTHCDPPYLAELRAVGLDAVEAVHPSASNAQVEFLRQTARTLGLAVSGGSDTHGTDCPTRRVGSLGLGPDDWSALRAVAGRA